MHSKAFLQLLVYLYHFIASFVWSLNKIKIINSSRGYKEICIKYLTKHQHMAELSWHNKSTPVLGWLMFAPCPLGLKSMSCSRVSAVRGGCVHGTACCQADLAQVMNGQSLQRGALIAFNQLSRSKTYGLVFSIYRYIYVQKYFIDIYIINTVIILINCLHCHNNWQLQPLTSHWKSPIRASVSKAFTD